MERLRGEIVEVRRRLLDAAPEARLYLFRTSRCLGDMRSEGRAEVRQAQAAGARDLPWTQHGMSTDGLGPEERFDGCRFNARNRDAIVDGPTPILARSVDREGPLDTAVLGAAEGSRP